MGAVLHLPPRKLPMRPLGLRVCSYPVLCKQCGATFESVASTASEAERIAWDLLCQHLRTFHTE
jgi:hypothetical protein